MRKEQLARFEELADDSEAAGEHAMAALVAGIAAIYAMGEERRAIALLAPLVEECGGDAELMNFAGPGAGRVQ